MRINVYVDGFNLYYGSLKGQPYKWLNLEEMCELLLPNFRGPAGSLLHGSGQGET